MMEDIVMILLYRQLELARAKAVIALIELGMER